VWSFQLDISSMLWCLNPVLAQNPYMDWLLRLWEPISGAALVLLVTWVTLLVHATHKALERQRRQAGGAGTPAVGAAAEGGREARRGEAAGTHAAAGGRLAHRRSVGTGAAVSVTA
jgi:hypothetical protein